MAGTQTSLPQTEVTRQDGQASIFTAINSSDLQRQQLDRLLPTATTPGPGPSKQIKLYRYRFCILTLFCVLSASNAYQWLHYAIIQNLTADFYNVSAVAIDWTSMVYAAAYIPLVFPASWFLDRFGLRTCVTTGAVLNFVGAVVKCFSAHRERFSVALVGQTTCAVAQAFLISLPAQLAAVWFGLHEVSTACAVGVFGNQIGVALTFVIPPLIVRSSASNVEAIRNELFILFSSTALVAAVILLAVIVLFRARPPQPPSLAEKIHEKISDATANVDKSRFLLDLKRLAKNSNFLLLFFSYGINAGIYGAIGTRLNFIILHYFANGDENDASIQQHAGFIGLTLVLAGLFGSIVCGYVLDRTHRYKSTAVVVYFFSLCGTLGFAVLLQLMRGSLLIAYVIAGTLGFFMTGYLPVGYEFGVELTYPVQEGTSSGMLNMGFMAFGILITLAFGVVYEYTSSVLYSNLTLAVLMAAGFVMTLCIDGKVLKRTRGVVEAAKRQDQR